MTSRRRIIKMGEGQGKDSNVRPGGRLTLETERRKILKRRDKITPLEERVCLFKDRQEGRERSVTRREDVGV